MDYSFSTVSATIALIRAGKLRAHRRDRPRALPNPAGRPTLDESRLKGVSCDPWVGLFAPAPTPDAIIKRLYDATKVTLADPRVRQKLIAGGNDIVGSNSSPVPRLPRRGEQEVGRVVKASNVKMDE